jgi:predicted Zn-dependent protease
MNRLLSGALLLCLVLPAAAACPAEERATQPYGLLEIMEDELQRSMKNLGQASDVPLYFLQYSVTAITGLQLEVQDGGHFAPQQTRRRFLDVDLRVGSMELDNTHEIRGSGAGVYRPRHHSAPFPLTDDPAAARAVLWNETELKYHQAQEHFTKVLADRRVMVEEEDLSNDFSPSEARKYNEEPVDTAVDVERWQALLKKVGTYLAGFPFVRTSGAGLTVEDVTSTMANSEGSQLEHGNHYHRFWLQVQGMADDGMDLLRSETYSARSLDGLPGEEAIMADAGRLVRELEALIDAPVVEPYIGPAILRNRASGVFFHEIFGHRIEGHRQKSESEGQTFTKKVGEQILPEFISVYDDPTLDTFGGKDLRGFYRFDDEGTPAQRVIVVENGILRNFLTTRSPIAGFPVSNGHARREFGSGVVARQGNLVISSGKTVPYHELRQLLIDECIRQDKPYGLVFDDISGGFTTTGRRGTQSFKVLPLLVHRVYADGRPDEVVRGVDVVGTPLTSFSKILMAAADDDVFNGTCGAESGSVPVSAISPSILVTEIEVEKRSKGQEKPPILPPPGHDKRKEENR